MTPWLFYAALIPPVLFAMVLIGLFRVHRNRVLFGITAVLEVLAIEAIVVEPLAESFVVPWLARTAAMGDAYWHIGATLVVESALAALLAAPLVAALRGVSLASGS
ncbi:MAG: hypothetical protein U1F23_06640 [Lysobacterales bacterium]